MRFTHNRCHSVALGGCEQICRAKNTVLFRNPSTTGVDRGKETCSDQFFNCVRTLCVFIFFFFGKKKKKRRASCVPFMCCVLNCMRRVGMSKIKVAGQGFQTTAHKFLLDFHWRHSQFDESCFCEKPLLCRFQHVSIAFFVCVEHRALSHYFAFRADIERRFVDVLAT